MTLLLLSAESICEIILRLTLLTKRCLQLFRAGRCPRLAWLCGPQRASEGLNLPHAEWGLLEPAAPSVLAVLSRGDHDLNNGDVVSSFQGLSSSSTLPGALLCYDLCLEWLGVSGTLLFEDAAPLSAFQAQFSCCLNEGGAEVSVNLNSLFCSHGNMLRGHQLKEWYSTSVGSGNKIEHTSKLLEYGINLVTL